MMRPLFFIAMFACFFAGAQTISDPVFILKPSLGLNGCQVHGDTYSGYDKIGFFAGIAVNGRLSKKSSLELGFYFSQKGSRHIPKPDKGDFNYYRLNLNYIDLPLSFRYQLNKAYFITAGPSIAYLINHKENIDYIDRTGMYKYNKFELGINAGLGRKLGNKFFVEIRTSNSITPIRTFFNPVYYPNAVARFFNKGFYNNILTLLVTYKLDFTKKSANG